MKRFLLGTVALIAFAAPAAAADLAARPYTKAPPLIAAIYDWSGFYIGANGGWGSSRKCWDSVTARRRIHRSPKVAMTRPAALPVVRSVIAGSPPPGCSALKRRATGPTSAATTSSAPGAFRNHTKVDAFGLFTGQVGYAANNVLLYVKGGAAVTGDQLPRHWRAVSRLEVANSGDDTRWGGTVGAGLEYGFAPNWSAGVEYDHMFMQARPTPCSTTASPVSPAPCSISTRIRQDVDLVTVRVNYRWGGPVIAKY